MVTRRSATTAASAPTTGTQQQPIAGTNGGTIVSGNQVASSSGTIATRGRTRTNRPIPRTTPGTVARGASTAASRRDLAGRGADEPERGECAARGGPRTAASRSRRRRRRARGRRSTARTTEDRDRRDLGAGRARAVEARDRAAPRPASASASRPTHGGELVGGPQAGVPMVPTTSPNRSPSWSGGTSRDEGRQGRRDARPRPDRGRAVHAGRHGGVVDERARRGSGRVAGPGTDRRPWDAQERGASAVALARDR